MRIGLEEGEVIEVVRRTLAKSITNLLVDFASDPAVDEFSHVVHILCRLVSHLG